MFFVPSIILNIQPYNILEFEDIGNIDTREYVSFKNNLLIPFV